MSFISVCIILSNNIEFHSSKNINYCYMPPHTMVSWYFVTFRDCWMANCNIPQTRWWYVVITSQCVNSLPPGRCGCDFKCVIFTPLLVSDIVSISNEYCEYCHQVNATRTMTSQKNNKTASMLMGYTPYIHVMPSLTWVWKMYISKSWDLSCCRSWFFPG